MTHAFSMTLGTLAGVIAGLAVFVAAAQIILKLFVSPTFWGIAACLIAICTLWTIWDGHQREIYLHGVEYKHEKVKEAEAWHQLQEQHDARLCKSQAETYLLTDSYVTLSFEAIITQPQRSRIRAFRGRLNDHLKRVSV